MVQSVINQHIEIVPSMPNNSFCQEGRPMKSLFSPLTSSPGVATPHIAGYSMQGKINGTTAVVRATGEFFGIPDLKAFSLPSAEKPFSLTRYDIMADDRALRSDPASFESLRSHYNYR